MYAPHQHRDASHAPDQADLDPASAELDPALADEALAAYAAGADHLRALLDRVGKHLHHALMAVLHRVHGSAEVARTMNAAGAKPAAAPPGEREIYLANAAAFDARAEQNTFLQRALARHRAGGAAPETAAPETAAPEPAAPAPAAPETAAPETAAPEAAAPEAAAPEAAPETTAAPETKPAPPETATETAEPATPEVDPREAYLAAKAASDARWERESFFQRALARHRGETVEPEVTQVEERKPEEPAPAEEAAAEEAPVVKETVTAPPAEASTPAEASSGAVDLSTAISKAQAAPLTTTRQGIDALNNQGSFDYRLEKVQGIRQDIVQETDDQISPDVSPEVRDLMKQHIGDISDEQMVALQGYTSQDYQHINKVLRDPDADPEKTKLLAGYIESIKAGLAALPDYEGEVYRGTTMSQGMWARWQQAHAGGEHVYDPAFSSSSKDEDVAEDFLSNNRTDDKVPVFCRIQSRTGKQVEFLSRTANEAEVLFNAGARFKIIYIDEAIGPDGLPRKEVFLREVADDPGDVGGGR